MTAFYSMGIMNYCSHDPGCALLKVEDSNFDMIFAEEGFLSRKKKSYQFPIRSMKYCLDYFNIDLGRVDVLMLDYMDTKRTYRTSHNYRLLVGDFIRSRLKISPEKIKYARSHHYAHALTAFWPSEFSEAGVLIVDGLGTQQQTHSIFHMSTDGRMELVFEQKGVGIGTLYTLLTRTLGFASGEEGKTMGLAPYGRNAAMFDHDLPSLRGNFDGFVTDYSEQIFRNPSPALRFKIPLPRTKEDVYEPFYARLAFNLQSETERCLTHLATETLKKTNTKNLCFAGGVALNCVANNHIQHLDGLEGLFVQPAAGDTGIPIGLALAGLEASGFNLSSLLTKENRAKLAIPYSRDRTPLSYLYEERLNRFFVENKVTRTPFDHQEIAKKISEQKIVALFSEGIELGPRALGHRSFIADARHPNMKDILNQKIKHRESYRPFAPIVLKEDFNSYFSSNCDNHPYMLQAPMCKERALTEVPAICHVDGTARVQTIGKELGKVREILESYRKLTEVSVLVNTSFNDNDEPIVFTKLDALNAFLNCNADVLVLEDEVIFREDLGEISSLKQQIVAMIEEIRRTYFKLALESLTTIKSGAGRDDLFQFLDFNAKLTKSYRSDRIVIKLIDFLTSRDMSKVLYLDNYHLTQIGKLAKLIGCSVDDLTGLTCYVEDNYFSGQKMEHESDFILYNFSAFHLNNRLQEKHSNFNSLNSFYDLEDKILEIDTTFGAGISFGEDRDCVEEILSTYEHNRSTSIDSLFSKIGITRG